MSNWMMFDRVEIDLLGHRLYVDGEEVPLERKAFAVLVLLAGEPGRVFSRDEILDAVWEHRHVTPGVLNRIITLLRHALGETAGDHRYLQTVHGVGYRLDAQVRRRHQRESTPAPSGGAGPGAEAAGSPEHGDAIPDAAAKSEASEWKRRLRQSGYVWLASLVLLSASLAWRHWHVASPGGASTQGPVLVVLPLHPVGNTPSEAELAAGLSEELITRLAHIDGLRVISTASAVRAQAHKLDSKGLARELRASHVLEGSLLQADGQLRVDLRLVRIPDDHMLWAQSYSRRTTHVLSLERDIAQAVASAMTLRLGLGPRAQSAPDTDPVLFRDYLEARRIARGPGREHGVAMLRAIVARSPDYAPAHASLARILASNLRYREAPPTEIEEARVEVARAEALDPGLAETLTARAILACREANWDTCIDLFKRALAMDPADTDCRTTYAYWLAGIGYIDGALEQAQIAWESDPLSRNVNFVLGRLLDTAGRHREAEPYVAVERGGSPYASWFNAIWQHQFARAGRVAEDMSRDEGFRDSYLAFTAALQDPSAWPRARAAIEASEHRGASFNVGRILVPHPDYPHVIAGLEHMLRAGWPSYYLLLWMPEYAHLRRDPAFQDFLQRTHIIEYWKAHGWPPQCRAVDGKAVCA